MLNFFFCVGMRPAGILLLQRQLYMAILPEQLFTGEDKWVIRSLHVTVGEPTKDFLPIAGPLQHLGPCIAFQQSHKDKDGEDELLL